MRKLLQNDIEDVCLSDFGETVTVTDGVTSHPVKCLWRESYLEVDPDTRVPIISQEPKVIFAKDSLPFEPGPVMRIVRGDKMYSVIKPVEKQDNGSVVLYLTYTDDE